tara:strand:- start:378 stop:542 length:165 start_codon:yes stop_codon:yes gene_type:complete
MFNLKDNISRSRYNDLVNGYRAGRIKRAVNVNGKMIYGELQQIKDRIYLNTTKL